ncbi:MAG: OmpA family protein, partial [Myxococcota bacterium]
MNRRNCGAWVAVLVLAGCGMGQEEHQKLLNEALAEQKATMDAEMKKLQGAHSTELSKKQSEIEGRDSLIAGLEDEVRTLGGNLEEVRKNMGDELAAQAAAAEAAREELKASQQEILQLKRLREQAEAEKAQFAALTARFKSMIDAGRLEVVRRDGRMMLKLPDAILFPSGSKKLKKGGREALVEVAGVLKDAAADREFLVAGHTDNVPLKRGGRFRSNWELSTARATEVVKLLIDQGVAPESLAAAGYGQYDPIAS